MKTNELMESTEILLWVHQSDAMKPIHEVIGSSPASVDFVFVYSDSLSGYLTLTYNKPGCGYSACTKRQVGLITSILQNHFCTDQHVQCNLNPSFSSNVRYSIITSILHYPPVAALVSLSKTLNHNSFGWDVKV